MPRPQRDPGLQPERTALAWQRTGLAAAGVCLILALTAIRLGSLLVGVLAAGMTITTLVVAVRGFPHGHQRTAAELSAWPALVRIAVIVMTVAAIGALLAVETLLAGPRHLLPGP